LFENWKSYLDFQKWLLWMWTRLQLEKGYINECAQNARNVQEFTDLIFCNIIEHLNKVSFDDIYLQRRSVLAQLNLSAPSSFWEAVKNMETPDVLRILTDLSPKEIEAIFERLCGYGYEKNKEIIAILRKTYPALANYLLYDSDYAINGLTAKHKNYFHKYRWHKVTNSLSEGFLTEVKNIAREKGESVYGLKPRNFAVNDKYDSNSTIVFVDAMGAEYIDYLAYKLDNACRKNYIINYEVGYCNLPSTTDNNKDFLKDKSISEEIRDLDDLKHGHSSYPNNILREMDILDALTNKIEDFFESGKSKIILTSDHGTSRLAVLIRETTFDQKVSAQGNIVYNHGRYCEGTNIAEDVPMAIEQNDRLIFADYTRFAQQGAPGIEIHGGASIEEWLVPIITIEKLSDNSDKEFANKIILESNELKLDNLTKTVIIEFKFESAITESVYVSVRGKRKKCEKHEERYTFKYEPLDGETEFIAIIYVGNNKICEKNFSIKRPLSRNKKFEI